VVPLPIDDELIVRANGGAQLAAGADLAIVAAVLAEKGVFGGEELRRTACWVSSGWIVAFDPYAPSCHDHAGSPS
jgi:hypothetical protein